MTVPTPYLDAIQMLPGETPGQKFRWIMNLIKERLHATNRLEDVVECEKIPKPLVPLVQIQAAMILNEKDHDNQSSYAAIAEALKSTDEMVVHRALQARNFFNGTNKTITNSQYFFDNLFPYVSLNTRTRIIKTLATRLASKNSDLAEEFFLAVSSFYGLEQALPLLVACSESFMYNTIVDRKIVLSRKLVKQIFRSNPDIVVRYLRLSKPNTDPCARNLHPVNIYDFGDVLAALIKKRLDLFVELYEMHKNLPPNVNLSNKRAEAFLKNGKEHLLRNPKLYIKLLPLRKISNSRMEAIFAKLFPENIKDFNTNDMLNYLHYYPQDKKVEFFLKTYQQVYGKSILDDLGKITIELLKILPPEERTRQARIKLQEEDNSLKEMGYTHSWRCYLPAKESIPYFKDAITSTSEMEYRAAIASKMIYTCKVNNDDQSLLAVLTYLKNRHKNEQYWFHSKVFQTMLELYNLPHMGNDYWTILLDMIVRAHVKNDLLAGSSISVKILSAAIHYKILQNQPIDMLINILVDLKSMRCTGYWNILQNYPEYERMCLEACVNVVSKKYNSDKTPWREDKVGILFDLCSSIYHFNKSHVTKTNRIERMSIKNYPWMIQAIEEILSTTDQSNIYIIANLQSILVSERDLYDRFWPKSKELACVKKGEALKVLKKNPKHILDHWREYLKACEDKWNYEQSKRFVRAVRWYNHIPMRFVEKCLQDLTQNQDIICLEILAILVHGETYTQIIEPLLPTSKTVEIHQEDARTRYTLVAQVIASMNFANPPVSLSVLNRLCEGDYLLDTLRALITVTRKTNAMDVISFARTLSNQRVSVRKHGIRLIHMVAPREQLLTFLHSQWETEKNHSIREVLFTMAKKVYQNDPGPATWSLFVHMFSTLTPKERKLFSDSLLLINSVSDQYVVEFVKLILNMIDRFAEADVEKWQITTYITVLLNHINAAICNLLPEDFIKELIRRFLFYGGINISRCAAMFVVTTLLLPTKDKFDERMKIFSSVFKEVVESGWNVPHPDNPHFYPVNNALNLFIEVVTHTFSFLDMELRLIDGILSTFLSVLTPQMDPTSYLLLVYSREQVFSKTPKEFGIKVGQRLPELIEIFSSLFIFFMTDVLQCTLGWNTFKDYDKNDVNLGIIEGLMEVGTIEAALMAVKLLTPITSKEYTERYDKVMMKFSEFDHPVIKSIVCNIINKTCSDE
ncbi:hypothetical protein WN48_10552 [Eufriesea mexicana]|uniref:uncharacterized protein LOC108547023 n=1 Tax=Eufriesea mexicana TaxID=516756 RepID=UPI00083BE6B5|nr:PREDICTED: uncharacterized protein LOC108547023 [Eufriesea mexicana]OAD58668.1 hypothetical protein WN48_10552 [Eufriesea mexicana]